MMLATFTGLSIFLTGNHQLLAQNPNNPINSNRPANCPMLNAQNNSDEISPNQNMMPGRQGRMMFDPNTVTSISGEIVSVDQITKPRRNNQNNNQNTNQNNPRNNHEGIHLTLKYADQTIDVRVGPAWYLAQEKMVLTAGDQVTIKGFPMNKNDQSFFIAQEITKGSQVLVLRDENGMPMWRGQGQKAGQGMRRQPREY
jgi:hypothetical protein